MAIPLKSMPLKSTALQRGLSLVELVAVLAIIGVLTSISVPMYSEYITRSKVMTAYEILTGQSKVLANYFADNGTYLNASVCSATVGKAVLTKLSTADWQISCNPSSSTDFELRAIGTSPALKDSSGGNPVDIGIKNNSERAFNGYSIGWMGTSTQNGITAFAGCWPTQKNQTKCTGS